jgi:hypothetical protein
MKEHSKYPFRSARLGAVFSIPMVNNRAEHTPGRGTYRLQVVVDDVVNANGEGVFFAIGRGGFDKYFPAVISKTTCKAEYLGPSCHLLIAGVVHAVQFCAVEVDILDEQTIYFWSQPGTGVVKMVKVGDLPMEDPELEGRRRG